jgi:hypothetical protein
MLNHKSTHQRYRRCEQASAQVIDPLGQHDAVIYRDIHHVCVKGRQPFEHQTKITPDTLLATSGVERHILVYAIVIDQFQRRLEIQIVAGGKKLLDHRLRTQRWGANELVNRLWKAYQVAVEQAEA